MSRSTDTSCYVLGVDGGGTKTEAWLARVLTTGEPVVIGRGLAGPSNPRAVGLEQALVNLGAAIDAAWVDARLDAAPVETAVLAMSGVGNTPRRDQVLAWADERRLARHASLVHDADPLLAAGTPEGWGVALIVGTGSAAIAVDRQGRREVVGGWGYWFGDEGSAYWIGRRALESVAHAADGRAGPTALTAAMIERLQVEDPRLMLGALEATDNVRGAISRLAEVVAAVAAESDATAMAIADQAAEELAAMVIAAASKLELGLDFPLALGGGVACGSELLRERLSIALAAKFCKPQPVTTVPHPAAGCIKLAWQLGSGI